jgi:hypothetical protein
MCGASITPNNDIQHAFVPMTDAVPTRGSLGGTSRRRPDGALAGLGEKHKNLQHVLKNGEVFARQASRGSRERICGNACACGFVRQLRQPPAAYSIRTNIRE